ncbi:hypothetical protein QR685DRAFT_531775 [Neurospora intermedia]|uniref:Uncharacterized protein n=1 Tax=Neurospora intermedia TaxID=5142 RepID=A0ABR3D5D8_NEUIN
MSANQPGFNITIIPQNMAPSYNVTMTETATGTLIITMTLVNQPNDTPSTTYQPYNTPPPTPPHTGAGADSEDSDNNTSEAE